MKKTDIKIIHDKWGVVEGVEEVHDEDGAFDCWLKEGAVRLPSDGWRPVPEVVEEDVTGEVQINNEGITTRFHHSNKDILIRDITRDKRYSFRKPEMYDPPKDWKERLFNYGRSNLLTEDIESLEVFLNQFRKPCLTVWKRREK